MGGREVLHPRAAIGAGVVRANIADTGNYTHRIRGKLMGKWLVVVIVATVLVACVAGPVATTPAPAAAVDVAAGMAPSSGAVLLESTARTTSTTSTELTNHWWPGAILVLDLTGRAGSTTLTPTLTIVEQSTGATFDAWTATAAIDSDDTTVAYLFRPGAGSGSSFTEAVPLALPSKWRVTVAHSDGDPITYSVACMYLQ